MVLDFAITKTHLFTTSTDSRLKVWNFRKDKLVGDFVIEGLGIAIAVLEYVYPTKKPGERFEDEIDEPTCRDFTFLAIGLINGFTVYQFDYRLNTLTHVGARNLPNLAEEKKTKDDKDEEKETLCLSDLKFWNKFVPRDDENFWHERQLRLIVCAGKHVFTYDIPSFVVTDTQRDEKGPKPLTEIVVANEDSFFVVHAEANVWYMRTNKDEERAHSADMHNDNHDDPGDDEYSKM